MMEDQVGDIGGSNVYTSTRKMSIILKTTLRERTEANMVRNHGLAYIDV